MSNQVKRGNSGCSVWPVLGLMHAWGGAVPLFGSWLPSTNNSNRAGWMNLDNPRSLLSLALYDSEGGKVKVCRAFGFTVNSVTAKVLSWHLGIRQLNQKKRRFRLSRPSAKSSISSQFLSSTSSLFSLSQMGIFHPTLQSWTSLSLALCQGVCF